MKKKAHKLKQPVLIHPLRHSIVLGAIMLSAGLLIWRAVDLQVSDSEFLQGQGDARHLRVMEISAHRGMITDRNGEPLAISTPVDSVWVNPQELITASAEWPRLAKLLELDIDVLSQRVMTRQTREFVYLKRRINPDVAQQVKALGIPGVFLQREYRRYYPAGEVAAHVVGFTNVDDQGQEGLELAYDQWLQGTSGSKRVIKNRLGHVVEDVESINVPEPGKVLRLSIDRNIQYLAYRELKTAMRDHRAKSGSIVILDAKTSEVLAMVNQPSYNPNNRSTLKNSHVRNRAVTDVFEPGSTMKPFTVAAALESKKYLPGNVIKTAPGYFRVGRDTVRDTKNYGNLNLTDILVKSSNVGASKLALALEPEKLWDLYSRAGFGSLTHSGFPGEVSGLMTDHWKWSDIDQATFSFGYGMSVTSLQLAQAYTVLANEGRINPASFLALDGEALQPEQVMEPAVAKRVLKMMEAVVSEKGTGVKAGVVGYRVAGKTGTVHKSDVGGYSEERYLSIFAGMAPVSDPRLVAVVMINEPRTEAYHGGQAAAPAFSKVMGGALRQLGVVPDDVPRINMKRLHQKIAEQARPAQDESSMHAAVESRL
ncbi:Cell division protein FtsI [Peptidoglycan synthetase] [hydrothermal vent metagenome]|uniref:Cell division protein FtsI [Peptidoglycan synthetase] n=1 Tax=hydrothermal vent metagenome TaxID=652676 RepID=A0A3B0Z6T2_9ZZZZ